MKKTNIIALTLGVTTLIFFTVLKSNYTSQKQTNNKIAQQKQSIPSLPEEDNDLTLSIPNHSQDESPQSQIKPKEVKNSILDEPVISYKNANLTVQASNYPLPMLLKVISKETDIIFHPDQTVQSHLITADIDSVPTEEALKSLFEHYRFAFYYKDKKLFSMGIYPSDFDKNSYSDILENNLSSSGELNQTLPVAHSSVDSPEGLYQALSNARTSNEQEDLIFTGLQSSDENIRALSLQSTENQNISTDELEQFIDDDPSVIVRSIALSQLMMNEQLSTDYKNELAFYLSNDSSEDIRRQANDYLATLDHNDDEIGQQNLP